MSDPASEKPAEPADTEIVDAEVVAPDPDPAALLAEARAAQQSAVAPDYDERGVPTLDYVRAKIEGRVATAIGTTELTGETEQARALDEQLAERERRAREKLEELRRSLGG
ncbi:hypothetical protein SAMN05443637_10447 [Pseudonocardia thermophila]|jgi:hypothetical protein|uniref:PspA domain-containing protein n=1 Tax=Pseudonocardia thermophila TaxID=1848 RepID=A0A1M6QW80_PSETH|nr:hypothetical protein [Pseudonocardia thermophila]SHK24464.1 hypothetical protein SAMN05443637_10447 [Pseudonocardia thermophila]